jgi:polyhydroxybutyrate depolymerase
VISIHGFAEWPAHQQRMTHWNELADEYGFIVVYPSGRQVPKRWRTDSINDQSDARFISDLIDQLQQEYSIDPQRIYANGLSNGGGMSYFLSCTLSDRIAAFGGVAGAYLLPTEDCQPERPVPAIIFHGNTDPVVPFEGGPSRSFEIPFPVISDWVQELAARNGCSPAPITLPVQGEASGLHYSGCSQNAEVVYYIIDGGGHTWPGGDSLPKWIAGHTTQDIDATRLMWEFFSQHSRTE